MNKNEITKSCQEFISYIESVENGNEEYCSDTFEKYWIKITDILIEEKFGIEIFDRIKIYLSKIYLDNSCNYLLI